MNSRILLFIGFILALSFYFNWRFYLAHQREEEKLSEQKARLDELDHEKAEQESRLKGERGDIENWLADLLKQLDVAQKERDAIDERLKTAQDERDSPESGYREEDIRHQQDIVVDLESRLAQTKQRDVSQQSNLKVQLSESRGQQKATLQALDEQIKEAKLALANLREQLNTAREQRDFYGYPPLRASVVKQQALLQDLVDQRAIAQKNFNDTHSQIEADQKSNLVLSKEEESDLRNHFNEEKKKLEEMQQNLKTDRANLDANVDRVTLQLKQQDEKIDKLNRQIAAAKAKLSSF